MDRLLVEAGTRQDIPERSDDRGAAPHQDRIGIFRDDVRGCREEGPIGAKRHVVSTKQRPSNAMCRIVGSQVSRLSAVGTQ